MAISRHLFNAHHDDSIPLHCGDGKNRLRELVRTLDIESRRNRDLWCTRFEGRRRNKTTGP
jgi:hypothetical protein